MEETLVKYRSITAQISHTAIVDYHFANSVRNGLEVIQLLQQRGVEHVILCTAEYWKPGVQQQALSLGIQLCPKPVPQQIVVETIFDQTMAQSPALSAPVNGTAAVLTPNVLVIDDDDSIRLGWKLERKRLGIGTLEVFPSMEACEAAQPAYPQFDFAFVDKNIPDTVWRIDQVIAHLKARGVKQVIVATGESARDVAEDPLCAAADGIAPEKIPAVLPVSSVQSIHAASGTPV